VHGWVVLLAAALASPAGALDFAPCTEAGQEAFDCATIAVPLDRDAIAPGTVELAIQRLRGPAPDLPVLIALAGGPGQSATAFASTFATVFEGVVDAYQLVVFDQRGTGRSGVLDCPPLRERFADDTIAACGATLGAAARFYTTADSVLDLDDVRVALGVDRVSVAGVSYGTHVALQYARTFPDRVAALVLDSVVPPDGISALELESFGAVPRVLNDICGGGVCTEFATDPVADTASLVARLARPFGGRIVDGAGRRQRVFLDKPSLFGVLRLGDLRSLWHARYPGAVAAARRGDRAPLLRLAALAAIAFPAGTDVDPAVRDDSITLRLATACADVRFPWSEADPLPVRTRAVDAALGGVSPALLFPFDAPTVGASSIAAVCLSWPTTSLTRASSGAPLPDVPALMLAGTRDIRTPLENAEQVGALLPNALRVAVPGHGHSLLTGAECARTAATTFLREGIVGSPCGGVEPPFATEPPPPRSLRQVRGIGLQGFRGRVFAAVVDTLNDAISSAASVARIDRPVAVGGLRAGRVAGTFGLDSFHLTLERYVLVRRVVVNGSLDFDGAAFPSAHVTVRGAMAGSVDFGADGSVSGRLGGRAFRSNGLRRGRAAAGWLRPRVPGLPPIA
jgi:pimeloyl-ACP methyl ester carboxylesterase